MKKSTRMWQVVTSDSEEDRKSSKAKHSKKSSKKEKKDKKHKKKKKRSKAVDQNEYGKYGIIRESDFHTKSVSFNVWVREVKKMSDFNGPKWQAMELFREYMEDYNTATMPHEKYYDVEAYEMKKYNKKHSKKRKSGAVNDEESVRREWQRQKLEEEKKEFDLVMQTMNKEKIQEMRHQQQLRTQMQLYYKSGNVTEARRLEQLLNKVEDKSKKPSFDDE
ncbi:unnamed protein product [Aphanomyces euteiches]|uniref:Uncharacterized protein n=1 Tax=Aphanomyces euteiches TaxID=100861 RepID=A0A6G0WMF7_9STRA|nr:hypothetical protein Ae201684_013686 [Aphanomyces euteiches]KAH9156141.1 hypothetical protein AeRB84_001927 [Aphanomyces euteiches]